MTSHYSSPRPTQSYFGSDRGVEAAEDAERDLIVLQPPRCSVYPALPADYYCMDCHCFVSSHGHVRGAHRNHAFVTIREAAELHVPSLRAWMDRCENQLQQAESLLANLSRASQALERALHEEEAQLDARFDLVVQVLAEHKEMLKRQLRTHAASEHGEATQALSRVDDLVRYYGAYLEHCSALLVNIPPVEDMTTATVLWSADVMRTAELLGSATQVDDVWLPHLALPVARSHCTPETVQELLALDLEPYSGVDGGALPAALDIRPFRYHLLETERGLASNPLRMREDNARASGGRAAPSSSPPSRDTFARASMAGSDAAAGRTLSGGPALQLLPPTRPADRRSVVLFNQHTSLTRRVPVDGAQDAAVSGVAEAEDGRVSRPSSRPPSTPEERRSAGPLSHVLVRGSARYSTPGLYGWAVHIDRLGGGEPRAGDGPRAADGRVLAGVVSAADDYPSAAAAAVAEERDGVVWDGRTLLGPRKGETRTLPASLAPRAESNLRFVLEIGRPVPDPYSGAASVAPSRRPAPPACLHCFCDDQWAASVPLVAAGTTAARGWRLAVSVWSPEDQVTVRALSTSSAASLLAAAGSMTPATEVGESMRFASWRTPPRELRQDRSGAEDTSGMEDIFDYVSRIRKEE